MKTITTEGNELRFWDFGATKEVVNGDGTKTNEPIPGGDWVKKPVTVTVNAPESLDEALAVAKNDESRLLELVTKGLQSEAGEQSGAAPEGTFSKAMVSAAVKALKVSPQFRNLQRKELASAVMRFVGSNEGIKIGFLTAFEGLRNAEPEDTDEE